VSSQTRTLAFRARTSDGGLLIGLSVRNPAEVGDFLMRVEELPGVRAVTPNIVESVVYVFDWLDKETARRQLTDLPKTTR
jgi:hypothetical protein